MNDYYEGQLLRMDGLIEATVPITVCNGDTCTSIVGLVDTGCHYTMISLRDGADIGFQPPTKKSEKIIIKSANGGVIICVKIKAKIQIGGIIRPGYKLFWCQDARVKRNYIGMDFFDKYKLTINIKRNKIFISDNTKCVGCIKKDAKRRAK